MDTPPDTAARWLVAVAVAAMVLTTLAVCLPLPGHRAVAVGVVLGLAGVGLASTSGAVAAAGTDPCAAFRFSPERWRAALGDDLSAWQTSDSERLAAAVVRCDVVGRADARTVVAELGEPQRRSGHSWVWIVGGTGDIWGAGPPEELIVRFDARGRVRDSEVQGGD